MLVFRGLDSMDFGWAQLLPVRIQKRLKPLDLWVALAMLGMEDSQRRLFLGGRRLFIQAELTVGPLSPSILYFLFVSFLRVISPIADVLVTFSSHLSQIESVQIITFHEILFGYLLN